MGLTEPLPLPGNRLESEEVPEHDRVGAGMGDDHDSLFRVVHGPEVSVILVHRVDPVRVHGRGEPRDNPVVKRSEALASW